MNWFWDIFIKRKLLATSAVVRTVASLLVAGGFVGANGWEVITRVNNP